MADSTNTIAIRTESRFMADLIRDRYLIKTATNNQSKTNKREIVNQFNSIRCRAFWVIFLNVIVAFLGPHGISYFHFMLNMRLSGTIATIVLLSLASCRLNGQK